MSMTYSFRVDDSLTEVKTTTITNERSVDEALSLLLSKINNDRWSARTVGLGIEKSFRSAENSGLVHEKVAILKLCSGNDCLIIQLIHFSTIPTSLAKFLDLPNLIFVGMRIKKHVAALQRDYGLQCRNAVELGPLAGVPKIPGSCDLVNMALRANMHYFHVLDVLFKTPDEVAFGEWDAISLSEEQIRHATIDAYATFFVGYNYGPVWETGSNLCDRGLNLCKFKFL